MTKTYHYRKTPKNSTTLRLTEDTVEYTTTKLGRLSIPFQELSEVSLSSPRPEEYLCVLKTRKGQKVLIPNRSFLGFGRFEAHNKDYLEFVQAIHTVVEKRDDIRFRAGSRLLYFISLSGLLCIGVGLVVLSSLLIWAWAKGKSVNPGSVIGVGAGIILFLPFAFWILKRKPRAYHPSKLPADFLPVEEQRIHQVRID